MALYPVLNQTANPHQAQRTRGQSGRADFGFLLRVRNRRIDQCEPFDGAVGPEPAHIQRERQNVTPRAPGA